MLKRMVVAGALALFAIGPVGAQSVAASQSAANLAAPVKFAAVQACEAQMRRLAGLNKTLAVNYNATRVHNDCLASTRDDVASKSELTAYAQ
jgi:hypothetical protein